MREETRDFIARELLIVATLVVVALVLAVVAVNLGYVVDIANLFAVVYFVRWVTWAAMRAAARPAQHAYLRRLTELTALGLILIDLLILVHGFRSGGPSLGHWLLAAPLGSLAVYLLQKSARRRAAVRART